MKNNLVLLLLSIVITPCFGAQSNSIHNVESKINDTKAVLQIDQQQLSTLQNKLQTYETTLSQLDNELINSKKSIETKLNELNKTQDNINNLSQHYNQQKSSLKLLIQQYYRSVQHNSLQDTLDHRHTLEQQRMSHYQKDLQHYLQNKIQQMNNTKNQLIMNQKNLSSQMVELTSMRNQLNVKQQLVVQHHEQRAMIVKFLSEKIKTEQQQLSELETNKHRLERVIEKLSTSPQNTAAYFINNKHFLSWPVDGEHTVEYGDYIPNTSLHSNGVVISAKLMTPVKAIAPGKVVFAQWMPGFGLLIILDHGSGYMSIYGHNATIRCKAGQRVEAQDVIGNVGYSGGLANPELYFAIRHNGKPLNPAHWCS